MSYDNNKPYPLRLGELKPALQLLSVEKKWSMSLLIRTIVADNTEVKRAIEEIKKNKKK